MKLFDLFNQSVVVVGGSSGMGRAIAAAAAVEIMWRPACLKTYLAMPNTITKPLHRA
jgi:hypothetical protein